jgi:hypothetical protein
MHTKNLPEVALEAEVDTAADMVGVIGEKNFRRKGKPHRLDAIGVKRNL